MSHTVVIGAGPAGLTTAYELSKHRQHVTLIEASDKVGGLFRTEEYQGYRIDLGAGGLSSQEASVQGLWDELVSADAVKVEVRSLIYFHHRLFKYPLSATNALKHLGPIDTALAGLSYLKNWLTEQQTPAAEEHTSQVWIDRRFGPHLNRIFFEPYFKKMWGRASEQLAPHMASRVLTRASGKDNTLIHTAVDAAIEANPPEVTYPARGAGQAWQACKQLTEKAGATFALNTQPIKIEHSDNQITQVIATAGDNIQTIPVDHLVSSLPLAELVDLLNAPPEIQQAAHSLKHRHLIQVALMIDIAELCSEQWIYVNNPAVQVSRIQNFKNWSGAMVPSPDKTCLGLTYFCDEADALWQRDDTALIQLAGQELAELKLIESLRHIQAGTVIRQSQAYPIHTPSTIQQRAVVQNYLEGFQNLQTVGRHGLHCYSQLADELLTGRQAAENILSVQSAQPPYTRHNLWASPAQTAAAATPMTF